MVWAIASSCLCEYKLTTEDLISIGVTSVGHRRKLLSAIAALRAADAPPDLTPLTAPSGSPLPHPPLPALVPGITGEGRMGAGGRPSGGS